MTNIDWRCVGLKNKSNSYRPQYEVRFTGHVVVLLTEVELKSCGEKGNAFLFDVKNLR